MTGGRAVSPASLPGDGKAHVAPGRARHHQVVTLNWLSTSLCRQKRLTVLVPPVRSQDAGPHPVLILLHGFGGSRHTWLASTRLVEHLRDSELLIVLPESGRRWFINDHAGLRYEDYLLQEVVPFVRENFDVREDREGWAIGGFSMGGATAMMQALRHPRVFSAVISHAGAFEGPLRRGDPYQAVRSSGTCLMPTTEIHERVWGPFGSPTRDLYDPYTLIRDRDASAELSVYADVGTGDYKRMIRMNRNTVAALRAAGVPVEYQERSGGHDLDFLDSALPHSLDFAHRKLGRHPAARIGPGLIATRNAAPAPTAVPAGGLHPAADLLLSR